MNDQFQVVSQLSAAIEKEENKKILADLKRYGNTPVIYGPTRSMVRPPAKEGLINTILQSNNVDEIQAIVTKATTEYVNASPKTIRRWNKVAQTRIRQLQKA
jgi:hypothetical protein